MLVDRHAGCILSKHAGQIGSTIPLDDYSWRADTAVGTIWVLDDELLYSSSTPAIASTTSKRHPQGDQLLLRDSVLIG